MAKVNVVYGEFLLRGTLKFNLFFSEDKISRNRKDGELRREIEREEEKAERGKEMKEGNSWKDQEARPEFPRSTGRLISPSSGFNPGTPGARWFEKGSEWRERREEWGKGSRGGGACIRFLREVSTNAEVWDVCEVGG